MPYVDEFDLGIEVPQCDRAAQSVLEVRIADAGFRGDTSGPVPDHHVQVLCAEDRFGTSGLTEIHGVGGTVREPTKYSGNSWP